MESDDVSVLCLVAGGPEHLLPEYLQENRERTFIGVDEGVLYLQKRGITPEAAFGDFDSISEEDTARLSKQDIHMFSFDREKDMTDLELAIQWAIEQRPDWIILYGATGGRLDHELINIQMLKLGLDRGIEMKIVDCKNEIFLKAQGTYTLEIDERYPYISFLPFSPRVKGITLDGFKYPLNKADLEWGSTLCISNELVTKKGTYSFDDGIIMVIRSKD